ncbi:MAG TPA: N-methyl-L-tryptophan oxidase [Pirellulaceae bacterium]|nr:N-methyl-L-tryptophan oxidase [Pirellulaceae bacterium]
MSTDYDLIVCGVGGIGSAALYAAARAGLRVIGVEQFGYAHDRGSSHGQTRIIRTAYFEHPDYVPLAQQSWQQWELIQSQCEQPLMRRTGLIQIGPSESSIIQGVRASADQHRLPVSHLTADDIMSRWPVLNVPRDWVGVFEEQAGYLRVERCIAHLIALAKKQGAHFAPNQSIISWRVADDGRIHVRTTANEFVARRAVFTAGPWSSDFLNGLGIRLEVVRKQQHWFQIDRPDIHEALGMSCFLFDQPAGGVFYGFPALDSLGVKIAEHSGGQSVGNPSEVDRALDQSDLDRVMEFARARFCFSRVRMTHYSVCMYTKSPDEHFIVDRHPRWPQIAFVCGLSGHGFKFAPVLGQHVVGLLTDAPNPHCHFLGMARLISHAPET